MIRSTKPNDMNIGQTFLDSAIKRLNNYRLLGEQTFEQLTSEQMLIQPNEATNSIAIIIQHLHGNMKSRWTNFLTEDGEKSWRNRDKEFELPELDKEQLIKLWDEGWNVLLQSIGLLSEMDLAKTITIRSEPLTVVDAINRQIAHYSYHVGQIVFLGKWIRNESWLSLSIPKKGSDAFNKKMQDDYK